MQNRLEPNRCNSTQLNSTQLVLVCLPRCCCCCCCCFCAEPNPIQFNSNQFESNLSLSASPRLSLAGLVVSSLPPLLSALGNSNKWSGRRHFVLFNFWSRKGPAKQESRPTQLPSSRIIPFERGTNVCEVVTRNRMATFGKGEMSFTSGHKNWKKNNREAEQ